MKRSSLLLLPVLISGCTFATRPVLLKFQREGKPTDSGWLKIESSQFTLVTDLSLDAAQEAAQDIAGELEAVEAAFGNTAPRFENKIILVVYENGIDFENRFGRSYSSMTKLDPQAHEHTIYLWGRSTRWVHHNMVGQAVSAGSTLRQTLVHAVLGRQISAALLPSWLKHGLGGYIETLAWSEDGKTIELGAANLNYLEMYQNDRSLGFTDVIGPQRDHPGQQEAYMRAFDGYCWALVYTAVNTHPQGLGSYLAQLADGKPVHPGIVFDGAPPEKIDEEVQQFILRGQFSMRTAPVDSHPIAAKVTYLTDEELSHYSPPPR